MAHIVLGVSGASGSVLAQRALVHLIQEGHVVELVLSSAALLTARLELGQEFATPQGFLSILTPEQKECVRIHRNGELGASIASGSYLTDGMLLLPCSMATLAAVAVGLSDNLIRRVADVMLKERRRLVVVAREAPLTEAHLENMLKVTRMGGVILPPVPAWYLRPQTLDDVEENIVARAFDLLGLSAPFAKRWESG